MNNIVEDFKTTKLIKVQRQIYKCSRRRLVSNH
jgi:hypothetical protein